MTKEITIPDKQTLALVKEQTAELVTIIGSGNEMELVLYEKTMTISKAIEGTSLKKMSKNIGEKNLTTLIVFLINRLASNFNVGKKFTLEQTIRIALDLIESFEYETFEDVFLMLKMVRIGRLGDGKDFKIDSQTMFHKWFPQYLELKAETRENAHKRSKDEFTALPKWDINDLDKFQVSDKNDIKTVTTDRNTLGQRTKKDFETYGEPQYRNDRERTTPIIDRKTYLKALEYEASRVPYIENLHNALAHFKEKNEQDAINIIVKELNNRQ